MWFKQCQAYRLPETPDAAVLAAASQIIAGNALAMILDELAELLGGWQE